MLEEEQESTMTSEDQRQDDEGEQSKDDFYYYELANDVYGAHLAASYKVNKGFILKSNKTFYLLVFKVDPSRASMVSS